ncbi:hypothetical protein B0H10DRAFT_1778721 [Mycena sp. CBHHK59/15]|nr:hypothetical protein B0H10DRAFT_1778721 [Mycena sp. CBHHK59/15]
MRVTKCLANSVSGIMYGSASRSFPYSWTMTSRQFTGSSSQGIGRFVFVLQSIPGVLGIRNCLHDDGVSFLLSLEPCFSTLLGCVHHCFVSRNRDGDHVPSGIKTLDLHARQEVGDDGRIVVITFDILPITSSVKIKHGFLAECAVVVGAVFVLHDRGKL